MFDPSRTTTLRAQYMAEMRRRFYELRRAVVDAVWRDDIFGLEKKKPINFGILMANSTLGKKAFEFKTDSQKIGGFNTWLQGQVDAGILEKTTDGKPWQAKYIDSAYKKGSMRAYMDARPESMAQSVEGWNGARKQFLEMAFMQPERVSKIQFLYTRSYEELKGISAAMSQQMNRILADGISHGKHPRILARELAGSITGIESKRARVLARTEIIAAHAQGQLDSFKDLGVEELGIMAEISTAGDKRVCDQCEELEGKTYTVEEAEGMIPIHPNCVSGDMPVFAPGAKAILKTQYTGQIFDLVTEGGRRITTTPKHVLLTKFGLTTMESVYVGLDLVIDDGIYGRGQTPDYKNGIPCIADEFISALKTGNMGTVSVPTSPEYLHNEGGSCNKEIHIVFPNGELWNGFQTNRGESGLDNAFPFCQGGLDRTACSTSTKALIRMAHATDSSMGLHRDLLAFFLGCVLEADQICSGNISGRKSSVQNSFNNHIPINPELLRESINRHPTLKQFNYFPGININSILSGSIPDITALLIKAGFNGTPFHPVVFCDTVDGPFFDGVKFDKIISVESRHVVSFDVYDIQTESSLYAIDGVISSNCRCAWIPANVGEEKKSKF